MTSRSCKKCGMKLGPSAPGHVCARCMLEAGLSNATDWPAPEASPLSIEERADGSAPGRFGGYELLNEIGQGGMGLVYRARDLRLQRVVALKVMLAGQFAGTREVKRFRAETEAAARLDHPNIVPIYEVGEQHGRPFYSMKLMDGGSLASKLGDPRSLMAPREAVVLLSKLARAVHHAHQRAILHRDLKPGNVLLDDRGEPHVGDFGLAKRLDRVEDLTLPGVTMGSPGYMSPEQAAEHPETLTTASDIFSLGAIFYQVLTGRPPFEAPTAMATLEKLLRLDPPRPATLRPVIDVELETICLKCLEKDPRRRYDTASALADDLDRWLGGHPILARPVGSIERCGKWIRRNPKVAILLLLLGLVFVGGVAGIVAMNVRLSAANHAKDTANARLARQVRDFHWQKVEDLITGGKRGDALALLSHFLQLDPHDRPAAARTVAMLNSRRFVLPSGNALQHQAGVNAIDLSADGRWLATASLDQPVHIWSLPEGRIVATLSHPLHVTQCAFVADEPLVLTTTKDGTSRLWNWRQGTVVLAFPKAADAAFGTVLSKDRRLMLLLLAKENSMQLWDIATQKPLGEPMVLPTRIRWADFGPGPGNTKVSLASADGTVGIWSVPAGRPWLSPFKVPGDVTRLRFSADGSLLAVAWGQTVGLFRVQDGIKVRDFPEHRGQVLQIEFSPDDKRLVTMAYGNPVRIWDLETGRLLGRPIEAERPFAFFDMTADGRRLATRSGGGVARLWDAVTGEPLSEPFEHDGSVTAIRFTPDGRRLVTGSMDGTARLWQPQLEEPARAENLALKTSDHQPVAAFSADGSRIYWSSNHAVHIFDLQTGATIGRTLPHAATIYRLAESPDGRKLATAGWDSTARIWDAHTGRPLTPPLPHRWRLFSVAFSPDGRWLATGAAEGVTRIWNAETGEPVGPELMDQGSVANVVFRPDSRALLTASSAGHARLWSVETGRSIWAEPLRHHGGIAFAEFSPEGKRIVTAASDRTARIWDAESARPLSPPIRHEHGVVVARFSPDGQRILTCSEDGTARLWDARKGDPVSVPMRHAQELTAGMFSRDGRWILTATRGGEVRVWDGATGYPASEPMLHPGRRVTGIDISPDHQHFLSVADSDAVRVWRLADVPVPVPDWLPLLIEAVAGRRWNDRGEVEPASREMLETLRTRCRGSGTSMSSFGLYDRWACWFLGDGAAGTSPAFGP